MNYYVKIFYQEVSLWERSHNEGSIRERKDGKFEMRVTAGINFETGKAKQISYYADTKAEAVKLLHKIEYNIHISEMVDTTWIYQ